MPALEVPPSILLPRCPRCSHEWLDDAAQELLQRALHPVYEDVLKRRVRRAIDALCPRWISQRQLEQLLWLSQGYLSRLRAGSGVPSAELVSNLAVLALEPQRRLQELQDYWSEPEALFLAAARGTR
ncbi:MAG: hypothetical protein U1A78_32100 [Polyangia bacterium]